MSDLLTTEGAYLNGVYVLTETELRRTLKEARKEWAAELMAKKAERRRTQFRQSSARRYRRYLTLCRWFDERPAGSAWAAHLSELDKRYAANPATFTPQWEPQAREAGVSFPPPPVTSPGAASPGTGALSRSRVAAQAASHPTPRVPA